jgi:hypothetical protein
VSHCRNLEANYNLYALCETLRYRPLAPGLCATASQAGFSVASAVASTRSNS